MSVKFIDLNYKPSKNDLVAKFFVEPSKRDVINKVALESSTGTWTRLTEYSTKLGAKVFEIKNKTVKIAYPLQLFELGSIPQLLSSVAGNIFGMKAVKNLRLQDVQFPEKYARRFKGPKYGVNGVRKILRIRNRPLVGTIIKPKLGLKTEEHARQAYESWMGGLDLVKDDENLTSQEFNPFRKRVAETLHMRDKAETKTGEKKAYLPNITAPYEEMVERAEFVKERGGKYMMVDVITAGFSALQSLRNQNFPLIIHAHRAMHAAFTRNQKHGVSMLVLAKLLRLAGVDQLHVGTIYGKLEGNRQDVINTKEVITEQQVREHGDVLSQNWGTMKPVLPVSSGGLHPGLTQKVVSALGKDIVLQYGGGIHGHPSGTLAGARAVRQSVDAVMRGIPVKKHAEEHEELGKALEKWGTSTFS